MPRPKLTAAQKEKATLTKIKAGKSRATRGAVNELERRLKKGESIADLEKKLTSKEIKDVVNAVNQRKYGKNFVKISHYYKSGSTAATSIKGFMGVKLPGGAVGWMNEEGRIWTKVDSLETLNSLDAVTTGGRFSPSDTLVNKWSVASPRQKAEISRVLSEYDWDHVWNVIIQSDEKFKKSAGGDRVSKRTNFLEEIHGKIDTILAS